VSRLEGRINAIVQLGQSLLPVSGDLESVIQKAYIDNPWFTRENVIQSLEAVINEYCNQDKLSTWLSRYDIQETEGKNVGLILAGNIPLVGFHDVLSVFLTGHKAQIKLSDRDTILTKYIIAQLTNQAPEFKDAFEFVDRLSDYDAVIATGSDSTGKYFEKYFGSVPNIIRRNRNGVAIISADESASNLDKLGDDIFNYFGLGCRNVSKIYIEEGMTRDTIFEAIEKRKSIINHNKFKNNYDYSYALYLMNKEEFYTNNFLIMRPNTDIASRIACLHYEFFTDRQALEKQLLESKDLIQCIVSEKPVEGFTHFGFGQAQCPALEDYADGVDTIEFLSQL